MLESCSRIDIATMWQEVWKNSNHRSRIPKIQKGITIPQRRYISEFQKNTLQHVLSCCETLKDGCRDIQGDCDHDMECQPGTFYLYD